jgi:hypothetical protein
MSWTIEQITDAIDETKSERQSLVRQMRIYEQAWELNFWSREEYDLAQAKGWRLYTSPETRNAVSLALNLLSGDIKVICPAYEMTAEGQVNSEACGRFLETLIQKQAKLGDMSLKDGLLWHGAVKGRMVVQVAWIWNQLTDDQKKFMPPIIYRALDPAACGFKRDAYGTQWAFHEYKEKITTAKNRYPKFFKEKNTEGVPAQGLHKPEDRNEITFCDFWYLEKGEVYNCVLADNEFVVKPRKSIYPKIPMFERGNDPAPALNERWRSGGILEGMLGTWSEMNHLHSYHLTAVGKKYFPPMFLVDEEGGNQNLVIDTDPDAVNILPPGVKPAPGFDDRPDNGMLGSALETFSEQQQKATFPNALYGDTGQQRAAYGAHMMMSTAARRIVPLKNQFEILVEEANELALFMLKKFNPDEIELYTYDPAEGKGVSVKVGSDTIGERFDNTVRLNIVIPGGDTQKMLAALQLLSTPTPLLSNPTWRKNFLPPDVYVPEDEELRILVQDIENDPDLKKDMVRRAYYYRTGQELPPGEPDYEATAPAGGGPPPGGGPPGAAGPPPQGPQPMQAPPVTGPMMPAPEMQGMMSPDMQGMPQGDPMTQMMIQLQQQGGLSPEQMLAMQQGRFQRG